jgi:hypothetical protein
MRKVKHLNKTQQVKIKRRAFELNGYKILLPPMSLKKARKAPIQVSVGICLSPGVGPRVGGFFY